MRKILRVAAIVVGVLAIPGGASAVSAISTFNAMYDEGPARQVPAAQRSHDPSKPTAVVVVGEHGAVVSDVLGPYEILAASGAFNVYTVAPERRPVPLTGGLDLVPDHTFTSLPAKPDLVVVPALPDDSPAVVSWLRTQSGLTLTVCNGAGVLAASGRLDGRTATAHWMRISKYSDRFPAVRWVRGERFVDDGDIVTTAGILSGIDGALHVVSRLAGEEAAARAAKAVGWRYYGNTPPAFTTSVSMPDPVAIVNAGFRWNPQRIGVLLADGVGEIELASVFDVHGGQSLAARTLAVSDGGGPIRSRNGLTFLPRASLVDASDLDRVLVPGATRGVRATPEPEYVHSRPGFAFEATVADLARTTDVATARWTAKVTELPVEGLELEGRAWPWVPTLLLVALLVLPGAAVVFFRVAARRSRVR